MKFILRPWHLLVFIIAGLINRQQQQVIEFQNAQIRILMDKLGKKRILLTDDQRRMLAVKGKALGRKALFEYMSGHIPRRLRRPDKGNSPIPRCLRRGAASSDHRSHAGHHSPLASETHRGQVGLQRQAKW